MADLLFLTQRIPYPPNKGEKLRGLNILRYLATRFRVHLGALVDDPADWEHRKVLDDLCASTCLVPLHRAQAKLLCLRGLLTGEALSVTYFRDRTLSRWVDGVLARRPAGVFVFSSNMAPYVMDAPPMPGQRRVLELGDVDSEKWRSYAATARDPARRFVYGREARKVAALERRAAAFFDASVMVSAPETALLAGMAPESASRIVTIASGVDHAYFDPALAQPNPYPPAPASINGTDFVFTGTMDYPPNVDAVIWFATDVLPALRARVPGARFWIVGHSPTAEVRKLAAQEGVHVTGRVEDVRPWLRHAAAAVAPLRIARGIQNKVLEAMAMGRPVVASPEALEGIEAVAGVDVLAAAGAEAFVAACAGVVADPARAAGLGAAARARVLADHVWAERLAAFDRLLG